MDSVSHEADRIVAWAETKGRRAESPSYKRLTDAERLLILQLHDKGWSQLKISQHLSRSVSTVHDVIQAYAPTVDMAKRKLRAGAAKMAENIVERGDPRDHIQALKGLGVLQDEQSQGFTVLVGSGGVVNFGAAPAEAEVLEAEAVSPLRLPGESETSENA